MGTLNGGNPNFQGARLIFSKDEATVQKSGNITQFSYDALSRATKIEERTAGSVTSAKQHLWCRSERVEERDATGSLSTGKLFLALGQRNFVSGVGSNYFYTLDASPGSIREMIDATGGVIAQYSYDPYGVKTKIQGSGDSDFQYAGYYLNSRSSLYATVTRFYNANGAKFINRDSIGENGGVNLYGYVDNNPVSSKDSSGMGTIAMRVPPLMIPRPMPVPRPKPQEPPAPTNPHPGRHNNSGDDEDKDKDDDKGDCDDGGGGGGDGGGGDGGGGGGKNSPDADPVDNCILKAITAAVIRNSRLRTHLEESDIEGQDFMNYLDDAARRARNFARLIEDIELCKEGKDPYPNIKDIFGE